MKSLHFFENHPNTGFWFI